MAATQLNKYTKLNPKKITKLKWHSDVIRFSQNRNAKHPRIVTRVVKISSLDVHLSLHFQVNLITKPATLYFVSSNSAFPTISIALPSREMRKISSEQKTHRWNLDTDLCSLKAVRPTLENMKSAFYSFFIHHPVKRRQVQPSLIAFFNCNR